MSVNPLLRMALPFLSCGCYGAAGDAAKNGDRRPLWGTERCGAGQYNVRKFTALASALGLALLLAWHSSALGQIDAARQAQERGAELRRNGDLLGALRELDRAVELAPASSSAWFNRGLVRRDLKDCAAAVGDFSRALELQADSFNALYQRGNCRQALGEQASAVEDYSRAVLLPGRIDARFLAYFGRAEAQRRLGRLDEAYADYTQVIAMRTDTTALRSRAWVSFYRGRWRDAYRDAAKHVHDTEAKESDAAYSVILGTLALRMESRPREASEFLKQWQAKIDAVRWPAPVIAYLQHGDAKALLEAAKQPGERTEARAYLGVDLLAQGKQAQGVEVLRQVLADGDPAYLEYDLAYHELRRLGRAQPSDRRAPAR
jgi:tetratricopeptide (TPR) repeat protein